MAVRTAEDKALTLVMLGSEVLKSCDLGLTFDEAESLARKFLIEQAREIEREQVRVKEEAATRRLEEREVQTRRERREETYRKERAWASTIVEGLAGFEVEGHDYTYWYGTTVVWSILTLVEKGQIEEAKSKFAEMVRRRLREEAEADAKAAERSARLKDMFRLAVDAAIEEKAQEIGMEWTASLLTSTFALPSGQRVEWGLATVEQHRERMEMLAHNSASNMEAATRHRVAIDTLTETGATCLQDVA